MNTKDPKLIALQFNECINSRDLAGLSSLMTPDHTFVDRDNNVFRPKDIMVESWKKFFTMVPHYRNTFERVQSKENVVMILGYAFWSEEQPYDPAIWVATVVDDLLAEWHIYPDTGENRKRFGLI